MIVLPKLAVRMVASVPAAGVEGLNPSKWDRPVGFPGTMHPRQLVDVDLENDLETKASGLG